MGLLQAAIAFLESRAEPMDIMLNHVLEVTTTGDMTLSRLPVAPGDDEEA